MPIVLTGLPGCGTSTIGPLVAEQCGLEFVSLGAEWTGDEIDTAVLALPGGLAASAPVRRRLRHSALVVWLDGSDETLAANSDLSPADLASQRRAELGQLATAADVIVSVDGATGRRSDDDVAAEIAAAVADAPDRVARRHLTETVALGSGRSYPIHVGRGVSTLLSAVVPAAAKRVAIVTQEGVGLQVDSGREQRVFVVEDGEKAKRLEVVGELASEFARWGMTRADVVVSVGGGVVSDLAGFVAATYHRGIPVIHVSTTLLGQVDAAIGGKCGVNLPEGKNLVGAFWQPTAVLCEIDALATLPAREFVSGMGELAKYHFLGGGDLDRLPLVDRVARAARIKADVVAADEREGGHRAILNYGHTMAHALETVGGYDLRHGEAVGIGLIYAAELALRLGRIDQDRVAEHRRVVARYGLATTLPDRYDKEELVGLFSRDKKAITGTTFVLDGPNGVEVVELDDPQLLLEVCDAIVEQGENT